MQLGCCPLSWTWTGWQRTGMQCFSGSRKLMRWDGMQLGPRSNLATGGCTLVTTGVCFAAC